MHGALLTEGTVSVSTLRQALKEKSSLCIYTVTINQADDDNRLIFSCFKILHPCSITSDAFNIECAKIFQAYVLVVTLVLVEKQRNGLEGA